MQPTLNLPSNIDPTAWISEVLGTAGTIGGAILGGPIGAGVGGAAGSAVGSALEQQLRDKTIDRDKLLKESIMSGVSGALLTGTAQAAGVKPTLTTNIKRTLLNQAGFIGKEAGKKIKPATVYYHGTSKKAAADIEKYGIDMVKAKGVDAESPYAFFTAPTKGDASWYGPAIVPIYPQGKIKVLKQDSMLWANTMGQSRSIADSAKYAEQLRKMGYDMIESGNEQMILNPTKFKTATQLKLSGTNSKIVKPATVYYHGTPNPQSITSGFDLTKSGATSGSQGVFGKGVYLTNELDRAKLYGSAVEVPLKNAKIKTISPSTLQKELFAKDTNFGDPDLITKKYLNKGFDGIRVIDNTGKSEELVIFNTKVLNTKGIKLPPTGINPTLRGQ